MISKITAPLYLIKTTQKTVNTFYFWLLLFGSTHMFAQFNPSDISHLEFFVESTSINNTQHIANCESLFCLNHTNTEAAIITEQYCDVTNSCDEGCVRRWLDQSSYIPSAGFNPPEYTSGRNFGQDDSEKPCYISDCINGKPCIRGGGPYGVFSQDKYLEVQISDFLYLTGEFSIFLLGKPIDQTTTGDWFYYGQSNSFLRHDVTNNNLKLRVPGNLVRSISTNNSVSINQWQLIEVHRDSSNEITTFINGVNTSISNVILPGTFTFGYLFSNFKTEGNFGVTAMYGDIASFLIYNKKTSSIENGNIRTYFEDNYLDGNTLSTISLNQNNSNVIAYPNPVKNKITLKVKREKNNIQYTPILYDSLGKQIKTIINLVETENTIIFNMSLNTNLSKGLYLIKYGNNSIKLIKD